MARYPKSTSDQLRSIKRARRDDLGSILEDLREARDEIEAGNEQVDGLDEKKVDVDDLVTMIRWFDDDLGDELELGATAWNMFVEGLEIPEACGSFVEQYDACLEALETFDGLVEADNYPGIGDERREAWEEVVAAADQLADACDELGIDLTEVKEERVDVEDDDDVEVPSLDSQIIRRCVEQGVDVDRLSAAMEGRDNWGDLIHSFEYLTVLSAVLDAMKAEVSTS